MGNMVEFEPVPCVDLTQTWSLKTPEGRRGPQGVEGIVDLWNGTAQDAAVLVFGDDARREAIAERFAKKTQLSPDVVHQGLLDLKTLVEEALRLRNGPSVAIDPDEQYPVDAAGTWLKHGDGQNESRELLANFSAVIARDITYDDGTPDVRHSLEILATLDATKKPYTVSSQDFTAMAWPIEALGAKATIMPGPMKRDHLRAAIQLGSKDVETQRVYVHTGWRELDGVWSYCHGAGAITASGLREDIRVELSGSLAGYQLPTPPTDPVRIREALRASMDLRTLAPGGAMVTVLGAAYLAPLRPFLTAYPPDFVAWLAGPSGRFKTEYAVLGMQHFGAQFSNRNVPASFVATGNSLERLSHTTKDALLLVDDYYPATDRRTRDAMDLTAGRLLRGIGNQTGRNRMRSDTSQRPDLPPRCVAIATGERLPDGHSTNARLLLQPIDAPQELEPFKAHLTQAQEDRHAYSQAMACYLQWIAEHWEDLQQDVPETFRTLRTDAARLGSHAREPGQVAHLHLAWWFFTKCAEEAGALTSVEREAILNNTRTHLHALATAQGLLLANDTTVARFIGLLMGGFASKRIYVRGFDDKAPTIDPPEAWGWTLDMVEGLSGYAGTIAKSGQARLVGYLDSDYIYLLPAALQEYLAQACHAADQAWPVDAKTLYRELDDAKLLEPGTGNRLKLKKVQTRPIRLLWIHRQQLLDALSKDGDSGADEPQEGNDGEGIPF